MLASRCEGHVLRKSEYVPQDSKQSWIIRRLIIEMSGFYARSFRKHEAGTNLVKPDFSIRVATYPIQANFTRG